MLYEIGGNGLKRIDVHENEAKNNLPIGTVLYLNGYNNPDYVIVKNLGISERFASHGVTYLTVSLDDFSQSQKQAYILKYISQKQSDMIQIYIMDEIKTPDEVLTLWERSEGLRKAKQETQERKEKHLAELEAQGRELFKKYIPADAQSLILAINDNNESDLTTDYFAHSTTSTVILGYSINKRDLFSEMRKHAHKIPETAHLASGFGHFEARIVCDYHNIIPGYSHYSHWHDELNREHGSIMVFKTKAEAQAHIDKMGKPGSITFDGKLAAFHWEIEEEEIEHREKYSMGQGYYLKDGGGHNTGWRISKQSKYGQDWEKGLYIAMAKGVYFN